MNYCKMLILVSDIEGGSVLYFPPKYSLNYGVHLDCFNNSYHYYESASEKYPLKFLTRMKVVLYAL